MLLGCHNKVGIGRIETTFPLFKAFWYESEATVYIFYHTMSSQKLRVDARVEFSLDGQNWTDVKVAANVQLHEPVDCGEEEACGSDAEEAD